MDLLKRYLSEVRFWLPAKQQDDITAELAEDLRSQGEDREAALGRTLTQADWEAVLKERGHPLVVANGYLPQRYLIGPVLYPVYLFVLKIAVLCCLVPSIAVWIGMLIFSRSSASLHPSLWGALWPALITAAAVTFAFSMLERYQAKWLALWTPNKLPLRDTSRISRASTLFELVVNAMFVGWAIQALIAPALLERPEIRIAFTMAGRELLSGLTILAMGLVVLGAVNLARPFWTRARHGLRSASYGISSLLFAFSFRTQPLLDFTGSGVSADLTHFINQTLGGVMWGGIAISILLGAVELRKALTRAKPPSLVADALTMIS